MDPDQYPLITPASDWSAPTELPDLTKVGEIGLDTETNDEGLRNGFGPGWVKRRGHVCGVGVSWRGDGNRINKIYVPITHPDGVNFPKECVSQWLKAITKNNRVIFQNAPYDIGWMEADLGVPIPPVIDDIGCMAVMIDESVRAVTGYNKPYSLNAICHRLGVAEKNEKLLDEAAAIYGFPNAKEYMHKLPARYVGPYGEQDPASTQECAEKLRPEIIRQGLLRAYQLEMDLIPMVIAMRKHGVRIDIPHCEAAKVRLLKRRDVALEKLRHKLGTSNITIDHIRSHKWLTQTFDAARVPYEIQNKKPSFEKHWMRQGYIGRYQEGKQGHWLPMLIAEAKQCEEAAEKFVQGFLLDFSQNGRIHANFNQFKNEDGGTRTHRFSITDPPLQQMPGRPEIFLKDWTLTGDVVKILRGAFLPESGEKWFSPDYSQQEYRLIVHYAALEKCSKADDAVEMYRSNPDTDFHNMVVEMTGLIRQRAKDCNFAKSYGAGVAQFASMAGMELDEAKDIMDRYDEKMPFVKQLMAKCTKKAADNGYIKMLDGARMHFNFWEAAYLTKEERDRGWKDGWQMGECSEEEAKRRAAGDVPRPPGAIIGDRHPWMGAPLKRAFAHKAGNGLIQGGAARMAKMAMREMWKAGYVPLLQIHDEFPLSLAREKHGQEVAELMRAVGDQFNARVPFKVDGEWGGTWATAKGAWATAKPAR